MRTTRLAYNPFMDLDAALGQLAADPSAPLDVAELALHLARDEYPDLDVADYLGRLADLAHQARAHMGGDLERRVAGLSHFLFDDLRFRGNVQDYYEPDNSYLHSVMDRRLGLPITLSVVTMAVAARAGLTVHGVGLPGHFVVKAVDGAREVIFDPFHGGQILSPCDCEQLVRQVTGQPFGVSFAMIGRGQASRQSRTIRRVTAGSVAKSIPPATLGHDRFSSKPASAATCGASFAAISRNSSTVLPAMLAMIAVGNVRRYRRWWAMKCSMPSLSRPIELSMPPLVS